MKPLKTLSVVMLMTLIVTSHELRQRVFAGRCEEVNGSSIYPQGTNPTAYSNQKSISTHRPQDKHLLESDSNLSAGYPPQPVAVFTNRFEPLDYLDSDLVDEYYCDPSSSNCLEEPGSSSSHPVMLPLGDIALPEDVTSYTLNIVLDVETFVEFHEEIGNDNAGNRLSFTLSTDKGNNIATSIPTLNYRMASLGPQAEIMVFLTEPGSPHPGDSTSNTIAVFTTDDVVVIATAALLILIGFIIQTKQRIDCAWISFKGHYKCGQPRTNGQATTDEITAWDAMRMDPRKKSQSLTVASDAPGPESKLRTQEPSPPTTDLRDCELDKRETDSQSDVSPDVRSAEIVRIRNGDLKPRPSRRSLDDLPISADEAPPMTRPQIDPEVVSLMERNHPIQSQTKSNFQQQNPHSRSSMSSSSYTVSRRSVYADPNAYDHSRDTESSAAHLPNPSAGPIRKRLPLRGLAFLLFGTFVLVAVAVGVSKIRAKPTLHVVFKGNDIVRKVRMFSDFPDLSKLSKNHSSLSLVSRLQLLDTKRCRDQLHECKVSIVCDPTTRQGANCRCRTGYYFKDWACHECSNHCPADHYLVSSCSTNSDVICKPCTPCRDTQYEAAPCTTDKDTICVDVSFPVGILSMNRSHLPDDGLRISVTHSPNVFLERLTDMVALDTPMYITNNQQGLHFVWPRTSGLEIAVEVTGVYVVPEYHDVDARDDTKLFKKLNDPTQIAKDNYKHVQENFCRHPVPDYYSLQLERKTRSSVAELVWCDSKDPTVPACPPTYTDGKRFVQRSINEPCPKYQPDPRQSAEKLRDLENSVVCTEETDLLQEIFGIKWDSDVSEWMFPGKDCEDNKIECQRCVETAPCPEIEIRNYTFSLEDNRCCGISCYNKEHCMKAYSANCPEAKVECALGEVDIFSLYPQFPSMEREFACHLRYTPPAQLYSLSYAVRVPSIGLNISEKHFSVAPTSSEDHQKRLTRCDFIQAIHDTRIPVEEDIILQGDHAELSSDDGIFKPYRVRWLKTPEQLQRKTQYTRDPNNLMSYVQFEKPFLYSSSTWKREGCYKEMSQIYPNQSIYAEEVIPVLARKIKLAKSPTDSEVKKYSYQLHYTGREPYVKFLVDAKETVLQYLQGSAVNGILVPSSLYGRVTWHHDSSTWLLLFSGRQLNCPTVISLKIFTQMMTGCAGHFDILINCPEDFTVTFNLTTSKSDLPDVFVLQANDSRTSHNLVLSSLYSPLQVDELASRSSGGLSRKLGEGEATQREHGGQNGTKVIVHVWLPLLAVVITALILLLLIYGCYYYINANIPRMEFKAASGAGASANVSGGPANSSTTSNPVNGGGTVDPPVVVVALNNQGEKVNHMTTTTSIATTKDKDGVSKAGKAKPDGQKESSQSPKLIIVLFVVLYIIYSLVFSFSVTFGTLYMIQSQVWSNVSNPENLAQELHVEVDRALSEIRDFENDERERIFGSFLERRRACVNHLELENNRLLKDFDLTMRKQLHTIFVQNGTLHQFTADIQRQNVSAYVSQIKQFVQDCNKTVNSIVHLFQENYMRFLRHTALNGWLEVPRQIFLRQEGDSKLYVESMSTRRIKQFASWLDIDKVEELLNVEDNVFGRLNSVPEPQVTTLDMTFPSVHPGTPPLPTFNSEYQTFSYVPLDPPTLPSISGKEPQVLKANLSSSMQNMPRVTSFSAAGGHRSLVARHKRHVTGSGSGSGEAKRGKSGRNGYDSFGLSGSLKANPDSTEFSDEHFDTQDTTRSSLNKDALSSKIDSPFNLDASGGFDYDYDYEDETDFLQDNSGTEDLTTKYESRENLDLLSDIDRARGQTQRPRQYMHNSKPQSHGIDVLSVRNLRRKTELVSVQTVPMHTSYSNLITDNHKPEARYDTLGEPSNAGENQSKDSNSKDHDSGSERWLYSLVAMFLILDVVLWAYRLSWLSRQLHAARHGYADRIPTDDACKQVIEIQTAYHLPAFDSSGAHDESSSGYYVDGKDQSFYTHDLGGGVTGSGIRESSENMTFLQTLPRSRDDSILQKIWQQKMSKAEADKLEKLERGYNASKGGFARHWHAFCAALQRLFLSQLIWQATVTFLAIILLCLLVHCASFWLTAEHFRVLVGAQSAVSDVQFQLHASDHHLRTLALTLSQQLQRLQRLCDTEVDSLTSVFFDTVNMQTSMFTSLLQELCREAKNENCDSLSAHLSTGGRIVGCSFLPLQARTYHDLSLSQLERVLAREVTPLLEISRRLLTLSACAIAFLLCARLVCQATASTARHFLLLRGYLPRVRVYQAEETHNAGRSGVGASTLQRSQSWVDSCESGVYVCEADDGGMNNGGGAVATTHAPSPPVAPKEELMLVQPAR